MCGQDFAVKPHAQSWRVTILFIDRRSNEYFFAQIPDLCLCLVRLRLNDGSNNQQEIAAHVKEVEI
jgi:hypothetical protein